MKRLYHIPTKQINLNTYPRINTRIFYHKNLKTKEVKKCFSKNKNIILKFKNSNKNFERKEKELNGK